MRTLLVIIPDSLAAIIRKGEFADRYYNPGDLFDEVHILSLSDEPVDPESLQYTVGGARLHVHGLPVGSGLFIRSLGYRRSLLRKWSQQAVDLAARIKPDLVRCYAAGLNSYFALRIKQELGVPYVVSVHTVPDESDRVASPGLKGTLSRWAMRPLVASSLKQADQVVAVYRAIIPYLQDLGVRRVGLAYNVVAPGGVRVKEDYRLSDSPRIASVGRQLTGKAPFKLISALKDLPGVQLTVVGDGPLHDELVQAAVDAGLADRVVFERSVSNDELTERLPAYDIFASHSDYLELPKAVIEPLLAGLPVIVNRRPGRQVPEFEGADHLLLVEDDAAAYAAAIKRLIEDDAEREALGRRAAEHAHRLWDPKKTEEAWAEVARSVMKK